MATVIVQQQTGRGLLIRAMWFLFVGWWLSAVVIVVAFALRGSALVCVEIVVGMWFSP